MFSHHQNTQEDWPEGAMQSQVTRARPVFVNLKTRLHLNGVNALLSPTIRHLNETQYKRMLSAWQNLEQYHVYGYLHHQKVVALLALEGTPGQSARILSIAVTPSYQGRGFGKRLVVETFCSLNLQVLSTRSLSGTLPFYEGLQFACQVEQNQAGSPTYSCVLTREALFAAFTHEYSAGAVLFCKIGQVRHYVLVTELSGNTGLPKGHVEGGESNEETALREIMEETGLTAWIVPGFGGEIVYPQGKGMLKHFTYFLAEFDPQDPVISGPDVKALLLPYEQALRKLSFADVRVILRKAEETLVLKDMEV